MLVCGFSGRLALALPLLVGAAVAAHAQSPGGKPCKCRHLGARSPIPSGSVGAHWINPHNGPQLFHNFFHNQTTAQQTYSQSVQGTVTSSFDGTLSLSAACLRVGTQVEVSLKRDFTVHVPPRSSVTMVAYANMMRRSIEMLDTCRDCHEVLSVHSNWVTAARGINEYFRP